MDTKTEQKIETTADIHPHIKELVRTILKAPSHAQVGADTIAPIAVAVEMLIREVEALKQQLIMK